MDPAGQVGTVQVGGGSMLIWVIFIVEYLWDLSWVYHQLSLHPETWDSRATIYINFHPSHIPTDMASYSKITVHLKYLWWLLNVSRNILLDFEMTKWPQQSPGLNPSKHLWGTIHLSFWAVTSKPDGVMDSLWRMDAWLTIPVVESVTRVAAVIKARGALNLTR